MLNKNLSCSVIRNTICVYNSKLKHNLPQLVPFFFLNQVIFTFVLLIILIYGFSKYILPKFVALFVSRISLTKL